jgi:hypothetical protein
MLIKLRLTANGYHLPAAAVPLILYKTAIMELYISEEDLIRNIQHAFQQQYPHLNLQFYKHPHRAGEPSPPADRLSSALPIEEITMFHTSGSINIAATRTVAQVEQDFYHLLGLSVQVLRQWGNSWLETTGTDHWTLAQQEEKGKNSMAQKINTPDDYNLQDAD